MHPMTKQVRLLALALVTLPLHVGHEEPVLRQNVPSFILRILSRYEHLYMRGIDYLATRDWIHRHRLVKRFVDWLGERIMATSNGEVLTLVEAREMVANVADSGLAVAVGTCPCRRARRQFSRDVPNDSDMVFGLWAEEYLINYPGMYRRVGKDEALELLEEFDRHAMMHQVYGFGLKEDSAYVICNCSQDVCIPLLAQKTRGYQAFRKGRSRAAVDTDKCVGVEQCGICIERCPFDARVLTGGRASVDAEACFGCGLCVRTCRGGATTLERIPGAELIYARNLVR